MRRVLAIKVIFFIKNQKNGKQPHKMNDKTMIKYFYSKQLFKCVGRIRSFDLEAVTHGGVL